MPQVNTAQAHTLLQRLESLRMAYGAAAAAQKIDLLRRLGRLRLKRAATLMRYHEMLCWMVAYPDNAVLLAAVRAALARFAARADLKQFRAELANSGIAGTFVHCNFFWMMARWLALRCPDRLTLDWDGTAFEVRLRAALPLLLDWSEAEAVRRSKLPLRRLIDTLRGNAGDAVFIARAIERLPGDHFTHEQLHDSIDPAYALAPGAGTGCGAGARAKARARAGTDAGIAPGGGAPSRTLAYHAPAPLAFRASAPSAARPDLVRELQRKPVRIKPVHGAQARDLVDLARDAMLTRARDLVAFSWGDERDVTLVDDGDGLAIALIGSLPERRLPLPAVHGWLLLRNRVPVAYGQLDTLLGGAEVAFNLFESFRGGEAAYLFARLLAAARHALGARTFSLEPYQLGDDNDESIASGAWWFYYKLGFRPIAAGPQRVLAQELARMRKHPAHRSGSVTLKQLAAGHMVYEPARGRPVWLPWMPGVGLALKLMPEELAAQAALARFDLAGLSGWSANERLGWRRFAPALMALGGVETWSAGQKRAAANVVRAKGGRREAVYLARMEGHVPLRAALARLLQTSKGRTA